MISSRTSSFLGASTSTSNIPAASSSALPARQDRPRCDRRRGPLLIEARIFSNQNLQRRILQTLAENRAKYEAKKKQEQPPPAPALNPDPSTPPPLVPPPPPRVPGRKGRPPGTTNAARQAALLAQTLTPLPTRDDQGQRILRAPGPAQPAPRPTVESPPRSSSPSPLPPAVSSAMDGLYGDIGAGDFGGSLPVARRVQRRPPPPAPAPLPILSMDPLPAARSPPVPLDSVEDYDSDDSDESDSDEVEFALPPPGAVFTPDSKASWGRLEKLLGDAGVPEAQVFEVATTAVAWRYTTGGRPLIDRKRRKRAERNLLLVVERLEACGVPRGPAGIGRVLVSCPYLLLCKVTNNDRWDRRAIELAAFIWVHGHSNVPPETQECPELAIWVKRQRQARVQGTLTGERLAILEALQFDFGNNVQLTQDWERRFDEVVDYMLSCVEEGTPPDWTLYSWPDAMGSKGVQLALWVQLQREYRRMQLLPSEALPRLESIKFVWEPRENDSWLRRFGPVLYERDKLLRRLQIEATSPSAFLGPQSTAPASPPPPSGMPASVAAWFNAAFGGSDAAAAAAASQPGPNNGSNGVGGASTARPGSSGISFGGQHTPPIAAPLRTPLSILSAAANLPPSVAPSAARLSRTAAYKLAEEREARRQKLEQLGPAYLYLEDLTADPHRLFWIRWQQARYLRGRLDRPKLQLLVAANIPLDPYHPQFPEMVGAARGALQGGGAGATGRHVRRWVAVMRCLLRDGLLETERVEELRRAGLEALLAEGDRGRDSRGGGAGPERELPGGARDRSRSPGPGSVRPVPVASTAGSRWI